MVISNEELVKEKVWRFWKNVLPCEILDVTRLTVDKIGPLFLDLVDSKDLKLHDLLHIDVLKYQQYLDLLSTKGNIYPVFVDKKGRRINYTGIIDSAKALGLTFQTYWVVVLDVNCEEQPEICLDIYLRTDAPYLVGSEAIQAKYLRKDLTKPMFETYLTYWVLSKISQNPGLEAKFSEFLRKFRHHIVPALTILSEVAIDRVTSSFIDLVAKYVPEELLEQLNSLKKELERIKTEKLEKEKQKERTVKEVVSKTGQVLESIKPTTVEIPTTPQSQQQTQPIQKPSTKPTIRIEVQQPTPPSPKPSETKITQPIQPTQPVQPSQPPKQPLPSSPPKQPLFPPMEKPSEKILSSQPISSKPSEKPVEKPVEKLAEKPTEKLSEVKPVSKPVEVTIEEEEEEEEIPVETKEEIVSKITEEKVQKVKEERKGVDIGEVIERICDGVAKDEDFEILFNYLTLRKISLEALSKHIEASYKALNLVKGLVNKAREISKTDIDKAFRFLKIAHSILNNFGKVGVVEEHVVGEGFKTIRLGLREYLVNRISKRLGKIRDLTRLELMVREFVDYVMRRVEGIDLDQVVNTIEYYLTIVKPEDLEHVLPAIREVVRYANREEKNINEVFYIVKQFTQYSSFTTPILTMFRNAVSGFASKLGIPNLVAQMFIAKLVTAITQLLDQSDVDTIYELLFLEDVAILRTLKYKILDKIR